MSNIHLTLGGMFAGVFCIIAILHYIENKRLNSRNIRRIAWFRSIQLFAVMAMCFAIIVISDEQIISMQNKLESTPKATQEIIKAPETATPPKQSSYYPPIVDAPVAKESIEDVFNISNANDAQASIDSLKIRYEEILVTHFFLKKCNLSNAADYQLIASALSQEIKRLNAPARLQYDILTAAEGSYKEVYQKNNCSRPDVENVSKQYKQFIEKLSVKLNSK